MIFLKRMGLLEASARKRAEVEVTRRLRSIKGDKIFRLDRPKYTLSVEDNLVTGLTIEDFWEDLDAGDGSELSDSPNAPAKFCAAYSSSALVVNTFGPFRHSPDHLSLVGYSDFSKTNFERKCPTGLRGIPPNLDFFATGPKSLVAVESKFLEILQPKTAIFKKSYDTAIETLAEPVWEGMYQALLDDPAKYIHLDAAQLVKHYLGIRNTFSDCQAAKALVYMYWEPTNAEDLSEFREHRNEVALFSRAVEKSEIRFVAISYSELWRYWSDGSSWGGMLAHVNALKQRYELNI